MPCESSARGEQRSENGRIMKKTRDKAPAGSGDELRQEHTFDYSKARSNRFAARMTADTRAVVLDPDVAKVFTTPESANAVLRALIETMPRKGASGSRSE
jgi:hypothetical protein